jgi:hypothetical protein
VTPNKNPTTNGPHNSATKITSKSTENHQKGKWERQHKALRNHVESSIHTMRVHTRSSLSPDHPSFSLDLTSSSQASPRKLEENKNENEKTNELGFKSWLPSIPSRVYMEALKRPNYPYLITRDTCSSRENLGVFRFSPSNGCLETATLLSLDASLAIPTRILRFKASRRQRHGRSERPPWTVRPAQAI